MAKSKAAPTTETVDDSNKAVIDATPPTPPAPQPLDLRVAAMLGMGLDVVRERLEKLDESGYQSVEQFVNAKDHPSLAAMLSPVAKVAKTLE
jgi:hypothetical protein